MNGLFATAKSRRKDSADHRPTAWQPLLWRVQGPESTQSGPSGGDHRRGRQSVFRQDRHLDFPPYGSRAACRNTLGCHGCGPPGGRWTANVDVACDVGFLRNVDIAQLHDAIVEPALLDRCFTSLMLRMSSCRRTAPLVGCPGRCCASYDLWTTWH